MQKDKFLRDHAKNINQNMPMFWDIIQILYSAQGKEKHCSTSTVIPSVWLQV